MMTQRLSDIYTAQVEAGDIEADPVQEKLVRALDRLRRDVAAYDPRRARGWRKWLGLSRDNTPPRGFYIHGGVGRGKSMAMDLFFGETEVVGDRKRRVHFHEFMLDVHGRLHAWRENDETTDRSDPLPEIAADIARENILLCFDEFQVTNIADAMILSRLFGTLLDMGVVVVATSNLAPDELYENGLQRELFLPFIDIVKEKLRVMHMDGETDYRLRRLRGMNVYFVPHDDANAAALDAAFYHLIEDGDEEWLEGEGMTLEVQGREIHVPLAARGTARFSFEDLCGRPLGPADYLAIAREFHTLIISDIPLMGSEIRDKAARFVTLIDALYEHRVKLICTAAGVPDSLYPEGVGNFEFKRTASRLIEMQTKEYKALDHITGDESGA